MRAKEEASFNQVPLSPTHHDRAADEPSPQLVEQLESEEVCPSKLQGRINKKCCNHSSMSSLAMLNQRASNRQALMFNQNQHGSQMNRKLDNVQKRNQDLMKVGMQYYSQCDEKGLSSNQSPFSPRNSQPAVMCYTTISARKSGSAGSRINSLTLCQDSCSACGLSVGAGHAISSVNMNTRLSKHQKLSKHTHGVSFSKMIPDPAI